MFPDVVRQLKEFYIVFCKMVTRKAINDNSVGLQLTHMAAFLGIGKMKQVDSKGMGTMQRISDQHVEFEQLQVDDLRAAVAAKADEKLLVLRA